MKVRILSGNQTGAVVDMPRPEAESNIATGYAEAVIEETPVSKPVPAPAPRLSAGSRRAAAVKPAEVDPD